MHLKIFTLAFDERIQGFDDEVVNKFCANKKIIEIKTQYFNHAERIYWSINVIYTTTLDKEEKEKKGIVVLTEIEQKLLTLLKEWRRERAIAKGYPVYLICNNSHLEEIVKNRCTTLESFKKVRGFGKQKVTNYGKEINDIVRNYFEMKPTPKPPDDERKTE